MSEPADDDYSMRYDESAAETIPATARSERSRERERERERDKQREDEGELEPESERGKANSERDASASVAVDATLVNALYSRLKRGGYISQVKTQLRNRIVEELRERALTRKAVSKQEVVPSDSISVRVANSIVLQHLQACAYEYTVSVFVPESGLDGAVQAVSSAELLDLLRVERDSKVAKQLQAAGDRQFLLSLVRLMLEAVGSSHRPAAEPLDSRPEPADSHKQPSQRRKTLAEKFDEIDRAYEAKFARPSHETDFADEQVRRKLENEFEERFRKAFEFETARFRELELERVRKEQFERYRQDLERAKRATREEFESKLRAESEAFRAQTEKIRAEADARERELFVSRQKLLADTSILTDRHSTLDRDRELFEK